MPKPKKTKRVKRIKGWAIQTCENMWRFTNVKQSYYLRYGVKPAVLVIEE